MTQPPDPAAELRRLRRKLRDTREDLRLLRTEHAKCPPTQPEDPWAGMTADDIRHVYQQFKPTPAGKCPYCPDAHTGACETCGALHGRKCPRVKSIEYMTQGDRLLIRKVTYWPDGKWDRDRITFPEMLPPHPDVPEPEEEA